MTGDRTPEDHWTGADHAAAQGREDEYLARAEEETLCQWVDRGDADLEDREEAGMYDADAYPYGEMPDVDR